MTRWRKALLVGSLAAGLCLYAVALSSAAQISSRHEQLEQAAHLQARQLGARLQTGLEKHLIALEQMATFFENSKEVGDGGFHSFAAKTLARTPLCIRLSLVDPSFHVRSVHPLEPNRALLGYDVRRHALGYASLLRAIETKKTTLSPPLELVGGDRGFVLAAPIFRDGGFAGAVVCTFRSADFFASMTLPESLARYEESVEDAGVSIFATRVLTDRGAGVTTQVETFDFGGRTWTIRIRPKDDIVTADSRSGQMQFWVVGCLLGLGIGSATGVGAVWASEIAARFRSQGKALAEARNRLDGAMQQLLQAEKMTALGELVAGVAHEINNPLSTIMGYTQLLTMTEGLPEESKKRRLEIVYNEAERIARIVKNLLTFARKHPPEKKYLGLNGVIEKTLELKAYHFRVNQIGVVKELDPSLPKTMLDFHQMQQVFLNLFNNAEQALVESKQGGSITVRTGLRGDLIEARVSDDGPGIPDDILTRIFEPFFTTKKEGKGTGLGLSLCYGIVQEHGGAIHAESRPGQGATFVLTLPLVREEARVTEVAAAPAPGAVPQLRILVIDDEPRVQDFFVDLLALRGHKVDTASDVPEALEKIAGDRHDLIISDMKMPRGTGKDVYMAALARSPRLARRIVFTTGDGASAETQRFLKEAGNEIVPKPCTIEELEIAIARVVKG